MWEWRECAPLLKSSSLPLPTAFPTQTLLLGNKVSPLPTLLTNSSPLHSVKILPFCGAAASERTEARKVNSGHEQGLRRGTLKHPTRPAAPPRLAPPFPNKARVKTSGQSLASERKSTTSGAGDQPRRRQQPNKEALLVAKVNQTQLRHGRNGGVAVESPATSNADVHRLPLLEMADACKEKGETLMHSSPVDTN